MAKKQYLFFNKSLITKISIPYDSLLPIEINGLRWNWKVNFVLKLNFVRKWFEGYGHFNKRSIKYKEFFTVVITYTNIPAIC